MIRCLRRQGICSVCLVFLLAAGKLLPGLPEFSLGPVRKCFFPRVEPSVREAAFTAAEGTAAKIGQQVPCHHAVLVKAKDLLQFVRTFGHSRGLLPRHGFGGFGGVAEPLGRLAHFMKAGVVGRTVRRRAGVRSRDCRRRAVPAVPAPCAEPFWFPWTPASAWSCGRRLQLSLSGAELPPAPQGGKPGRRNGRRRGPPERPGGRRRTWNQVRRRVAGPLARRPATSGSPARSSRSRSWITSGSRAEPSTSESHLSSALTSVTAPASKSFFPVASTDRSRRAHIRI